MRMFDKNPFSSWMLKRDNQSNKAPLFFGTPLDSQTQKRPESMSWLGLQGHALTGGPSFCWFSGCILESWITTHGGKSLKGTRYTEQPLFQQNRLGEHMICNQFIKMYDNLVCLIWLKVLDLLADFRWFTYCDCILCTTVDVRNHAPVPVGLPHYLQVSYILDG